MKRERSPLCQSQTHPDQDSDRPAGGDQRGRWVDPPHLNVIEYSCSQLNCLEKRQIRAMICLSIVVSN
jgi:hypothetical protein